MKREEYAEIKVGDLVTVNNNSRDHGKNATVVEIPQDRHYHGGVIKIRFDDGREKMVTRWVINYQKNSIGKKKNKIGDKVFLHDRSYLMILEKNPDLVPAWKRIIGNREEFIKMKIFEVMETNLKIPALFGSGYLHGHFSALGEKTYLDTLVKDEKGDLFLTCDDFLFQD